MDNNPPSFSDGDTPLKSFFSSPSKQGLLTKSPYLNIDPSVSSYVSKPEFIFPEGASKQRGRFELAFGQIGASCMLGALAGGSSGLYRGLRETTLAGQTGRPRVTQLLNHISKQGSATANTLGVIAVMYSSFGVLLSLARGADDELNTIGAATATGMLFKSTSGLRKCGIGGAVGFSIATLYFIISSRDKLQSLTSSYSPA